MTPKRALTLLLAGALAACGPAEAPPPEAVQAPAAAPVEPSPVPPEVSAQLDSGSVAFRADDLEGALAHYTRAAELAPDLAAAWFGVYMAQEALGNLTAAQEALARTRELEPGMDLAHPPVRDSLP